MAPRTRSSQVTNPVIYYRGDIFYFYDFSCVYVLCLCINMNIIRFLHMVKQHRACMHGIELSISNTVKFALIKMRISVVGCMGMGDLHT